MRCYIIKDWAGNLPFGLRTFNSFESAWAHIYEQIPEELLNTYDDYYVEQARAF